MSAEFELFQGTNFSDLMRDIYHNSKKKSRQIDGLIKELQPLIKNTGDATVLVPMIKDYLEVSVKNDDALVKLAAVVQRLMTATSKDDDVAPGYNPNTGRVRINSGDGLDGITDVVTAVAAAQA